MCIPTVETLESKWLPRSATHFSGRKSLYKEFNLVEISKTLFLITFSLVLQLKIILSTSFPVKITKFWSSNCSTNSLVDFPKDEKGQILEMSFFLFSIDKTQLFEFFR